MMMRGSGEVTRRNRTTARGAGWMLPHINDHISMQVGAGSEVVAVMCSQETLAGAIGAFLPDNPTLAIRGVEADPERYDFSHYRQNILSLQKTIGATEPLLLDEGSYRREAGDMLLLSLAQALTGGLAVGPTPKGRRHFMCAIDFIEAHFFEEIRITAIANAAGCSIRLLQELFRALEGRTIVQHITARRLAHARSLLLKSAEGHSVTSAALDSGFSHFGLFARQYRTAFGELPSATRSAERAPRRGC
jgi:AraC-like DNA-binding protein